MTATMITTTFLGQNQPQAVSMGGIDPVNGTCFMPGADGQTILLLTASGQATVTVEAGSDGIFSDGKSLVIPFAGAETKAICLESGRFLDEQGILLTVTAEDSVTVTAACVAIR